MAQLLHAMGDVHPHALKAKLARELSRITFERWNREEEKGGKTIFCNSGFEAVEAALKTAVLATGKAGIIAFKGAYHGVGYGALNATHRVHFRGPFKSQLREFGRFVSFPTDQDLEITVKAVRKLLETRKVGAMLVEPIQVRGGINIPPAEFFPALRRLCDDYGALLVLDEIYTGFGRTGKWFACEHSNTVPDLICLGKALTGGFPLSACIGRADLMDRAWPAASGEAIHTSTFLGHPVGCAMALAQLEEIKRLKLVERSAAQGRVLLHLWRAGLANFRAVFSIRGLGLLAGVELRRNGSPATELALAAIKSMLRRGFIVLPEGEYSNVISFTPPLTLSGVQLSSAVKALAATLSALQ